MNSQTNADLEIGRALVFAFTRAKLRALAVQTNAETDARVVRQMAIPDRPRRQRKEARDNAND